MHTLSILLNTAAQAATETAKNLNTQVSTSLTPADIFEKGGVMMYPLVILSIIALYIFGERYFAIARARKFDNNMMNEIKQKIKAQEFNDALLICETSNTPMGRMIAKGIRRMGRPLSDVQTAIENVGNLEISKLEKGLPVLASVSGGAPMIGFLGTVMGMIQAFYEMSSAKNVDISNLAGGIYTAMSTTAGGLLVGILAYFAYNILVARVDKTVAIMEHTSTEFMDILHEPTKK
ncbi:MotA/TolQ/ExbB proton channel family protein [Halosquirtibacter laminarini]|uniref:MotA/TolQ/ExbB proton channel family protein n=1 Tax=Halosquirtibacter laminarini TaxID=3374600 RepID=A0AC61NFZ9_9BACT|nr:MotA/TolQ/ExbB proton channel family protein [Prolixibacteraceae bacterium]